MNSDDGGNGRGKPPAADEDWGSFEAKRGRKLICGADATPAQRLAWLEDALHVAWQSGALPRRPRPSDR